MTHKIELETAGTVWKLCVAAGDAVKAGQELFIMEVMKMEVPYEAPTAGVIQEVMIEEGQVLEEGHIAIVLG